MLGREDAVVNGVEGSSDSDSPVPDKKAQFEGDTLPTTEVR
jgi:hypothetical protein